MKNLLANTLKNPFIQSGHAGHAGHADRSAGSLRALGRGLAVAAVMMVLGSLILAAAF